MYGVSGFAEEIEYLELQKIQWEIVYIIYVRTGWICRKIEYPVPRKFNGEFYKVYVWNVEICRKIEYTELRKFNKKLCTLFMYG